MRSAWIAPLSPNNLFESWTGTLQKSIQSWCIPFVLQIWYHIRANEMPGNWRHLAMRFLHANLMYRMHLPYSPSECLGANFYRSSTGAGRQKYISPQSILMTLCSSDASFRTKNSIVMSTSCQVEAINLAFYMSSFTQAATGYKCWELPFSLVFHDHFSSKQ